MLQTPKAGKRLVKNLSVRWGFLFVLDLPAGRQVLCFEIVSDFGLQISDLPGGPVVSKVQNVVPCFRLCGSMSGPFLRLGCVRFFWQWGP
jgi:hypothetical protein